MRLSDLPNWYSSLPAFKKLRPSTQRAYKYWLQCGIDVLGAKSLVTSISYKKADNLLHVLTVTYGEHKAVSVCRVLSLIWNLLIRHGKAYLNPFSKMKLPGLKPRATLWELDEIARFSKACKDLGYESLGLMAELCFVIGQRPVDVRSLKRTNLVDHHLVFTQVKTSIPMNIYIPEQWMDKLISLMAHGNEYLFINPQTGKHYTARDYNKIAFDAKRRARIPLEKQLRDLRRTALTDAADHNATDSELMSLGGHKTTASLNVYRRRTGVQTENVMKKRGLT